MPINGIANNVQTNLPLKLWLVKHLDERTFQGLEWLDEQQYTFKIIWVDQHKPNDKTLEAICKAWAYNKDGEERELSFSQLKGRFRDALRNSNHIEKVDSLSVQHLQTGNFKVFRFLSQEEIKAKKNLKKKTSTDLTQPSPSPRQENGLKEISVEDLLSVLPNENENGAYQNFDNGQGDALSNAMLASNITVQNYSHTSVEPELSFLDPLAQVNQDCEVSNPRPWPHDSDPLIAQSSSSASDHSVNMQPTNPAPHFSSLEDIVTLLPGIPKDDLSKFEVILRYEKDVVCRTVLDFAQGGFFCPAGVQSPNRESAMFETLTFPPYNGSNKNARRVLDMGQKGFALKSASQGDLFGQRFCRSHIYVFNSENDTKSVRMEIRQDVCIFSYLKYINLMLDYQHGRREQRPDCEAMLVIGSEPATLLAPTWISLNIRPIVAEKLNEALGCSNSLSLRFSDDQSLDFLFANLDSIRDSQSPVSFASFEFECL